MIIRGLLFCSSEAFYSFVHERLSSPAREAGIRTIRRSLSGCRSHRRAEGLAFSFPRQWSRRSHESVCRSFHKYNIAVCAALAFLSLRQGTWGKLAPALADFAAGSRGRRSLGDAINQNLRLLAPKAADWIGTSRHSCSSYNRPASAFCSGSRGSQRIRRNGRNAYGSCWCIQRRTGRRQARLDLRWWTGLYLVDSRWIRAKPNQRAGLLKHPGRYPTSALGRISSETLWSPSYWMNRCKAPLQSNRPAFVPDCCGIASSVSRLVELP